MYPVLVVDDEAPIAELISITLSQIGLSCVQAHSGSEAADLTEEVHRHDPHAADYDEGAYRVGPRDCLHAADRGKGDEDDEKYDAAGRFVPIDEGLENCDAAHDLSTEHDIEHTTTRSEAQTASLSLKRPAIYSENVLYPVRRSLFAIQMQAMKEVSIDPAQFHQPGQPLR